MSDERPDTAPSPVHRPKPRNVMDTAREGNGVRVDIGRRSLWGVAKVIGAAGSLVLAIGAGWQTHQLASPAIEAKTASDVQAVQATAAATQKALDDHLARVAAEQAVLSRANEARDRDLADLKLDLAKHLSSIDTAMGFMQRDMESMRQTLGQSDRRQPRNRPTPARTRVDEH